MSRLISAFVVGVVSLAIGLITIYHEPSRELLVQTAAGYGIDFASLSAIPVVHDPVLNVRYVGSRHLEVEHFQNIFYAEDTSGNNRFAPPVKFTPSPGSIVDATEAGAWCPQGTGDILPFTSKVTNISEHCLSVRVARPQGTKPDAKLPVFVWIHGGGHALGSGYDSLYDPDGLVQQANADGYPIIYVGINYRLSFFGFATSDALLKAKHTNVGLRDQRAALEWVRDNINVFGGDPTQVTAVGQSVGASDIGLQLTAFRGKQGVPFQRAVMMSGGPGLNFNTKSDLVRNNTASIAEQVGCVKDGDAQSAATLACLRAAPADKLTTLAVSASRSARPPFGEAFFYPTQDNDFLPDRPSELLRSGRFTKNIPIIASWVSNDGAWYAPPTTASDADVLSTFGTWLTGHSPATKSRLLELYPVSDFTHMVRPDVDGPALSPQYYRAAQMNKDLWFTCPVLDFTWQYVRHGGAPVQDVRVYEHNATRFSPAFAAMGVPMWRVAHLSDIPYVFHNGQVADVAPAQLALGRKISRTFVEYVRRGTPEGTREGVESWPPAFEGLNVGHFAEEFPASLTLQLFGGPYGTRPVTVRRDGEGDGSSEAARAVAWERLFERCEFINSQTVREESGV